MQGEYSLDDGADDAASTGQRSFLRSRRISTPQPDQALAGGSVMRTDPLSGKRRVISQADYARTQLTRERDNELAMQAGAPPVAKSPQFATSSATGSDAMERQQLLSLASARPDRNITPQTVANATPEQVRGELSALGTGALIASRQRAAGGGQPAPAAPKPGGTLAPSDPNNPDSPLVQAAQNGQQPPKFAGPAAPTNPNLPASYDRPFQNVQFAAGPNISTAPTGLPQGSIGYQRKGGGYTVRTADGQTRDFADEGAARAEFARLAAFTLPKTPRTDAAPDAASQAWADNSSGRFAYQDTSRAPAPTQPAAPTPDMAPAYTIKGVGQRAGQVGAFLATDQSEGNPANFVDTAERYARAGARAAWDGTWQVPEKGLIRRGVEAVQEHNPTVRNVGTAIGGYQAQERQREAIAAGRIPPNFNERATQAHERYQAQRAMATQPNGAPTFAQMQADAVPVFPVPSGLQRVIDAATQPARAVPTPTNAITRVPGRGAPRFDAPSAADFAISEPAAFPLFPHRASGTRPLAILGGSNTR